MLTGSDQYFLVQLVGYAMGFLFAGIILLYFVFRIFKMIEELFFTVLDMIPPLFPKKKKVAE